MFIKEMMLYFKYGYKANTKVYYNYLKKKGVTLGKNVKFYSPWTIFVDIQRPWMIEIGDNVHITSGCRILQHGYDWCVLQKKYGDVLGSCGRVKIGNNVFLGVDTTILKGVTIGNDIIIGAKSLVNKDCLKSGVYAGNPIRYIMSIDEYYQKRQKKQLEEAVLLTKQYYKKYNEYPKKELLREFFFLFENEVECLCPTFLDVIDLEDNYDISINAFKNKNKRFENYSEFINFVKGENDEKNRT